MLTYVSNQCVAAIVTADPAYAPSGWRLCSSSRYAARNAASAM
jgi:hypothetical protein